LIYNYTQQLRSKEWKAYRKRIIQLDSGQCRRCNNEQFLHVHHKYYTKGLKPWEYPVEAVETLCRGCHAAEHGIVDKSLPGFGWEFIGEEDTGDLCSECELCGEPIRYEFTITHPEWGDLIVGTVCCDNLTGTSEASDRHKEAKARRKFVSSPLWRETINGWRRKIRGHNVRIYVFERRVGLVVNGVAANRYFDNELDLRMKIFSWSKPGAEFDQRFGV